METSALAQKHIEGERAPLSKLYTYASKSDLAILAVSILCASIAGVAVPIYAQVQGELFDSMADAHDESVSDAWIRNKVARGYARDDIKDMIEDKLNSDNSFYWDTIDTVKIMLVLGFIGFSAAWIGLMMFVRVGLNQANGYRRHYLAALLNKPVKYYETNKPGSVCASLDNECHRIEVATGEKLFILIYTAFFISLGVLLAMWANLQLTALCLVQLPITGFGSICLAKAMGKTAERKQAVLKESGGLAEECLQELPTVQSLNAQETIANKYEEILSRPTKALVFYGFIGGLGWGLMLSGGTFSTAIGFWAGSIMLDDNVENVITGDEIEAMDIVIITCVLTYACASMGNLAPCITSIVEGRVAAHVMLEAINGEKEPDGVIDQELTGSMQVSDLSFAYPLKPDTDVLKGLSFSMKAGQTVALVGESGSGKSTVMSLMFRFYEPTGGAIAFDGVDYRKLSVHKMRSQMSLVSQEPLLFNLSIQENIRIGRLEASDAEVEQAAERAGVMAYARGLPEGLKTNVGTKGSFLSGGQKQRIAIARAIIKAPKFLLLDEATSSLDNKTEAALQETLEQIGKMTSTLIIAQRLKTVTHADMIYVLKHGSLMEQGTHQELMDKQGLYYAMFVKQNPSTASPIDLEAAKRAETQIKTRPSEVKGPIKFKKTKAMRQILMLLRGNWIMLGIGCIFSILAGISFPATGYFLGEAIYYICAEDNDDMLNDVYEACIGLFIISSLSIGVFTINNGFLTSVAANFTIKVRKMAFLAMLYYDQAYMDDRTDRANQLTNILTVEAEKLYSMGGPVIGVTILVFSGIIFGVGIGIWHDWQLGIVFGTTLPILSIGLARGFVQTSSISSVDSQSSRALASDIVLNVKQVYAYNLQGYFVEHFMDKSYRLANKAFENSYESSMHYALQIMAFYYTFALAFWYGAWLIKEENLSYEKLTVVLFVEFFSVFGIMVASAVAPDLASGADATLLIADVIEHVPAIDSRSNTGGTPEVRGKVEFKNLSFNYVNREVQVLQDVSLTLEPGESLGLCGSTGSGKSTVVYMILRLYDPQQGSVLIDDTDAKQFNARHLRNQIGWVSQEPILFEGDLRFNMKLSKPDATDDQINDALKSSEAKAFIDLKGGLGCPVEFRGGNFSGGEKQRLALARALLRKPRIMILDEGTSALDNNTETLVLEELKRLQCTVVSIAHKMRTIEHCTKIIVLELGRVVEEGSHEALMARQQHYFRLVESGK
jgi:ABC-type multidrug transport system fused ATPase/permease subunit